MGKGKRKRKKGENTHHEREGKYQNGEGKKGEETIGNVCEWGGENGRGK